MVRCTLLKKVLTLDSLAQAFLEVQRLVFGIQASDLAIGRLAMMTSIGMSFQLVVAPLPLADRHSPQWIALYSPEEKTDWLCLG